MILAALFVASWRDGFTSPLGVSPCPAVPAPTRSGECSCVLFDHWIGLCFVHHARRGLLLGSCGGMQLSFGMLAAPGRPSPRCCCAWRCCCRCWVLVPAAAGAVSIKISNRRMQCFRLSMICARFVVAARACDCALTTPCGLLDLSCFFRDFALRAVSPQQFWKLTFRSAPYSSEAVHATPVVTGEWWLSRA